MCNKYDQIQEEGITEGSVCDEANCECCTRVKCEHPEKTYKEILKAISMLLVLATILLILTGCTTQPKIVERVKVQEVEVPVKLNIPELNCDFRGEGLEPTRNLLVCLILHKRVINIIRRGEVVDGMSIEEQIKQALEKDVSLQELKIK